MSNIEWTLNSILTTLQNIDRKLSVLEKEKIDNRYQLPLSDFDNQNPPPKFGKK